MNKKLEKILGAIAKEHLAMETLETQNSDSLDFKRGGDVVRKGRAHCRL